MYSAICTFSYTKYINIVTYTPQSGTIPRLLSNATTKRYPNYSFVYNNYNSTQK